MKASFVLIMLITGVGTGSSLPTLSLLAGCRPLTLPSSVTPAAHDSVCRKRPESLIPESLIIFDKQKLFLITIVKLSASTGKGTEASAAGRGYSPFGTRRRLFTMLLRGPRLIWLVAANSES